jgi:outer membrane protein assembly factor BamA
VEHKVTLKDKKAEVEYQIFSHQPYRIRNYSVQLNYPELQAIAADTSRSLIRQGMLFDVDILDAERERITSRFRQTGYYNFSKDFLVYSADSIK